MGILAKWQFDLTSPHFHKVVSQPDPSRFMFLHLHVLANGGIGFGTVYMQDCVGFEGAILTSFD